MPTFFINIRHVFESGFDKTKHQSRRALSKMHYAYQLFCPRFFSQTNLTKRKSNQGHGLKCIMLIVFW